MISHHAVLCKVDEPELYIGADFDAVNIVEYKSPTFTIQDVRQLISDAYRRPDGESTTQTLVVITNFITEEAQQALLKIVEEPPVSSKFIFVVPKGMSMLPTLLSRFQLGNAPEKDIDTRYFKEFLHAPLNRRLRLIENSVKNKDAGWQMAIKIGLIEYLGGETDKLSSEQLIGLSYVTRTLLTRGASNKFLLERLALLLPT